LVSESDAAPVLDPPALLPLADPEAPGVDPLELGELALPLAEPDPLPLMPPLAPGAELELLEPAGGVLAPGAELELLELPEGGVVVAPGEELELLLELPGLVLGAELVPLLDDDEAPGRVASPDFWPEVGLRSQPVAASAIATAAATSVR
jgi:hypothetical protein